jgi:predicted alpha/beta-fold hydrolase
MLDIDNQDGEDIIPAADEKEFVIRGTKRFERRLSTVRSSKRLLTPVEESVGAAEAQTGFFSRLMCGKGMNSQKIRDPNAVSPDESFYADCFVQLSKGRTAYRFIEPSNVSDEIADEIPVIVCLHGLTNSSYMWGDIVDLLSESEQGPQARVLVFDFYGRGRSPWNGVPITLDVLVTQTKELLDCKSLFQFPPKTVQLTFLTLFL